MENPEVQDAFLGYLYTMNFGATDPDLDDLDQWVKGRGFNKAVFWKQYELLGQAEMIRYDQDEGTVRLTPKGVLYTEKQGLVPQTQITRNREMRKQILRAMARHLADIGMVIERADLCRSTGISELDFNGNAQLLVGMGYGKWRRRLERLEISPKVLSQAAQRHVV